MAETLLAIDAGTTGVTAVLFDAELAPLARAYREFEQLFPAPGLVEHDAAAITGAVDAVLAEIASAVQAHGRPAALGITNQRETVFALERDPERPMRGPARGPVHRPARALGTGIVWQDRRTAGRCAELAESDAAELLRARTGLVCDPYFSATKIEWMLASRPEVRDRARAGAVVFATVDALVVNHLTAGRTFATDPTNASRTQLFDIDRNGWDDELCALFGVEPGWMPEVRPSVAAFGEVASGPFAGVPIHGVAGDQQAALYGQGCWDAGGSKATYGTGCFLLASTGAERRDSRSGLLTTLGVAADGGTCYALEGAVFAAGSTVQWLRDQAGFVERADESEALARSVPDTGGVFLVPAFTGLGAPYWDPDARGAILGLTRGTTRAHMVRAGLEAIAFQCAELIELFRADGGLALDELRVDGGASANGFLMQTQADLSGATVVRPGDVESTARGAALLAGVGARVVRDPAALPFLTQPAARFEPALGADERAARMAGWRAAVARVLTRP